MNKITKMIKGPKNIKRILNWIFKKNKFLNKNYIKDDKELSIYSNKDFSFQMNIILNILT